MKITLVLELEHQDGPKLSRAELVSALGEMEMDDIYAESFIQGADRDDESTYNVSIVEVKA